MDFAATRVVSIDMLMDCLMERYERNAEVQVLRLDTCHNISGEDVKRLEEIVVDIIWDGVDSEEYSLHTITRKIDSVIDDSLDSPECYSD
jgi:hypothetical protein